jgi:peptide/nickel transport system ATP-binding protein/oligopeptide transport system ATP-binding protein
MSKTEQPLLQVQHAKVYYPIRGGVFSKKTGEVRAVDDVSFSIMPHEALGLVGESGCGKSTLGRAILHLEELTGGKVLFDGEDITRFSRKEMGTVWPRMQMVFQDSYSSLNPRKTVEDTLAEILSVHHIVPAKEIGSEIDRLLQLIGLPTDAKRRYPYEFSGGQRQRISIAKALTLRPKLLICDEATSALDVSIQAQILNLFQELRYKMGLTYLFISHGLGAVKYISDRIAVMYLGQIVELATTELLFSSPLHPYTKALLSAYPDPDPDKRDRKRIVLQGGVPNPAAPPSGCRFRTRCPFAQPICAERTPELKGGGDHLVACHLQEDRAPQEEQP